MGTEMQNSEKLSPYKKKTFMTKATLVNILLFFIFFAVSGLNMFLPGKPTRSYPESLLGLISQTLGFMTIIALIGFIFAYGIHKGKESKIKNKHGLIYSIFIVFIFIIVDTAMKLSESKPVSNDVVSEQMSPEKRAKSEKASGKYYSDDGKYSIAFPEKPRKETVDLEIPNVGKTAFYYEIVPAENDLFFVNYADLSILKGMADEQVKNQLVTIRNEVLEKIHGQLINSQFFKFASASTKDCNGIDFSADYQNQNNDNCIYCARVLVVKERLYTIAVMTLKNKDLEKKVNDFLNSFIPFY